MGFKKINNISGWVVFAIALTVYFMTMEATVSFWDCGEFISAAYKLQVGHSPGAPLFAIIGRIFSLFAPNVSQVALFVNALSATVSALTIMFLFWSITHFAKKLVFKEDNSEVTSGNIIAVIGAGIVGALAYTFSDTFWFSAVEGEVYATSSLFTALVFWAILKWEQNCNEPYADRWLILIAYLVGLSVGVHLLSLLVIPTIALIYYFKRYNVTLTGSIIAFIIGGLILGIVQIGVIQYIPILASKFELTFVNSFGLPFNTGAIFFIVLLAAIIFFLIKWTRKNNKYGLYLSILSLAFISIGYISAYTTTIIRAKAGVSINMTNPDNVMTLIPYLQRTQYGQQPVAYGPYYTSKIVEFDDNGDIFMPKVENGKSTYVKVGTQPKYVYDENYFFPRIWSGNDPNHIRFYQNYLGLTQNDIPTGGDNISFFMGYQVNWMFWRYFMWNYAGRQNDYQGYGGEPNFGNWISGINGVDNALGKGDFTKMPTSFQNNKAHNSLYFLPFILGILGLVYQFNRSKKDGFIVLSFFFMTGIAVQLYINNTPMQPRERDYQYIAAYAYAIWIGIGVLMIRDLLGKAVKNAQATAALATVICLVAVPCVMASQEWDDHDRSQKTLALDHARNMLSNCDSNAILITNGDNETYPLWYIQEVEGFRKDIRILNYNLLGTDWQNAQMFHKQNNAAAIPMFWTKDFVNYFGNSNAYPVMDDPRLVGKSFNVEDIFKYMNDPKNVVETSGGPTAAIPSRNMFIPLDKIAIMNSGLVDPSDTNYMIPAQLEIKLEGRMVARPEVSMLNIIGGVAKAGWKRPIYVCAQVNVVGLDKYLQKEGVVSKLVPVVRTQPNAGLGVFTNLDKNIKLFNEVFTFGKANTDQVYYDESNKRTFMNYYLSATELANNLSVRGREADAIKVLNTMRSKISESSFPLIISHQEDISFLLIQSYYIAKDNKSARELGDKLVKFTEQNIDYTLTVKENKQQEMFGILSRSLYRISDLMQVAQRSGDTETASKWQKELSTLSSKLSQKVPAFAQMMQQMMQQQQAQQQQAQ